MDAGGRDQPPPRDGRDGRGSQEPFDAHPPHNQPYIQGSCRGGRPPPTALQWGCYAWLDHNKDNWNPTTICDARHCTGHVAANCDMLAMTIFLDKYKWDMLDDMKDKMESEWLEHWKGALGNPSRKPCHIMKAYLDLLDISVNNLDEQMCWECWPDDNDVGVADE
jgi:hypothetical protein